MQNALKRIKSILAQAEKGFCEVEDLCNYLKENKNEKVKKFNMNPGISLKKSWNLRRKIEGERNRNFTDLMAEDF